MFTPPIWFVLTAAKVRADSRLQPFMLAGAMTEETMDADIVTRIPTQAGIVFRRVGIALRPLGTAYELTADQKDSIIEATKLKVIQSLVSTDPNELMLAVSKAARQEAEDILKGLEAEFSDLAKTKMQSAASSGSARFSRFNQPGRANPIGIAILSDFDGTPPVALNPDGLNLDNVLIANNPPFYD